MKIKDLPPGLQELAIKRAFEYPNIFTYEDGSVNSINWCLTPERDSFWYRVHLGQFDAAYGCKIVNVRWKEIR